MVHGARDREVHIWRASVGSELHAPPMALSLLTAPECERLERCRSPIARAQFVIGRVMIRRVLAQYLGVEPEQVRIGLSEHGRPFVQDAPTIDFNLTHSSRSVLLAVGFCVRVGLDIEGMSAGKSRDNILPFLATAAERAYLESLPHDLFGPLLLKLWTRKEALLKLLGAGLTRDLRVIEADSTLRAPCGEITAHGITAFYRDLGIPQQFTGTLMCSPEPIGVHFHTFGQSAPSR